MTEQKEKKQQTTVYMTEDIYFTVDPDCMTLRQKPKDGKTLITLGYYSNHESLVKKAAKAIISDKGKKMIMSAYLEELRTIQNELLTKLK